MSKRSIYNGYITLGQFSAPVKTYSTHGGHTSPLTQIHKGCGAKVRSPKVCEKCGAIASREVQLAVQTGDRSYAEVDKSKLSLPDSKSIRIDGFCPMPPAEYYTGKSYVLLPSESGQDAYCLLYNCWPTDLCGIGQVTMYGRDQLVSLRRGSNCLRMDILFYPAEFSEPEKPAIATTANNEASKLLKTLIKASISTFDVSAYKCSYDEQLNLLVQAAISGGEFFYAPTKEDAPVHTSLIDALKASIAAVAKPAKKPAKSRKRKAG